MPNEDGNSDDLKALEGEIDAGVEDAVKAAEQRKAAAEAGDGKGDDDDDDARGEGDDRGAGEEDGPKAGEAADGKEGEGQDGKDGAGDDAITDEHLEKAVKAGLTMAEARQFTKASQLELFVSKLAGKDGSDGSDGDGDGKDGSEDEDPLAAIPDLDPEEYDEKIVDGFKALKDIIRSQQETIKGLRTQKPATDDWMRAEVSSMDKAVSEAAASDPTRMEAIREKFNVLEAGYKAAKKEISREAILQEAVRITMGDVIAKSAADKRSRELYRRGRQHINRPSGQRDTPAGDPAEEVAAEIDQKFFGKK